MKKIISILMALLLLLSVCAPMAFAANYELLAKSDVPMVRIGGDGTALVDENGEEILNYKGILKLFDDDSEDEDDGDNVILESVMNVVMPFLLDGLVTDNWEPYYDALYKEISELFANSLLRPDGTAVPGSGIQPKLKEYNEIRKNRDMADKNGKYGAWNYEYFYDWRLDPIENADILHEYVTTVKKSTGRDRVALFGSCIGSSVVLAYIDKYGTEDFCSITIDIATAGGAEILSNPISGQFNLDSEAIDRFLQDCNATGLFDVDAFLQQTVDLVAATGFVEILGEGVKATIYEKLVYGVTSALALSTFYTFPSYWAAVSSEDYEAAKLHVFGPEGSEKREEYAGLIEKIDNYDVKIRQQIPRILSKVEDDENCALSIIAKYGMQIAPIVKNTDAVGDQFASLTNASFGATTSTIFDTLSDDYIAARVAEGKGKYISPDKQVDASTCLYPDYTWFVKGASHTNYTFAEESIAMTIASAGKQLTVDDFDIGQFIVYDNETETCSKMTTENCDTYNWSTDEKPIEEDDKAGFGFRLITKLILWLIELIEMLAGKFGA